MAERLSRYVSGLSDCAIHEFDYPIFTPWNPYRYFSHKYVECWADVAFTDPFINKDPIWHGASLVTTYQTKGKDGQWSGVNEHSEAL